ncbi:MAG TPA: response regulator transcription factor [Bacteroidales bacterium]|mgnify:FL=1|jgi:DNA-binding response OmpR family regulator|nr:response regulator transcription factor [Bacteroidales bacterium]MDI9532985.1 response regulator transcription factor [Bacteroidota bacterium]OPZ55922.1 MAG: Transcriptional regulatory protein CusR [Bacteroidetes bacterium ADurb.BinA012]MBP7036149.1 response regulator transcription factor [Bacteroidales bacterium]MBP8710000.1 response regulator transcription factor [Bacteroidales bacterium]
MKILIIEDESRVASFIKEGLEEKSYKTVVAYDGITGEEAAMKDDISLVILDLIIPGKSGIDVCRSIKAVRPDLPILMLTALSTTVDKVRGFEAGADDYLVKPFDFPELLARIKSLLKRSRNSTHQTQSLRVADLELDLMRKVAIRGGKVIELTAKEFALLEYFMRNSGRVLSRADISEKVWNITYDTGTNIVEVYVNILRKKIDRDFEPKLIHTRIGLGYIFTDE